MLDSIPTAAEAREQALGSAVIWEAETYRIRIGTRAEPIDRDWDALEQAIERAQQAAVVEALRAIFEPRPDDWRWGMTLAAYGDHAKAALTEAERKLREGVR